jgi:hypothetical protein
VNDSTPPNCPNGHENPAGNQFCGTCGARLLSDVTQLEEPPSSKTPISNIPEQATAKGGLRSETDAGSEAERVGRSRTSQWEKVGAVIAVMVVAAIGLVVWHPWSKSAAATYSIQLEASECSLPGTPVTIKDASGTVIGTANFSTTYQTAHGNCYPMVTISHLPKEAYYQVSIPSATNTLTLSFAQLERDGWEEGVGLFGSGPLQLEVNPYLTSEF